MPSMSHDASRRTNAMESDFSSELEDQRSSASHEQLQRLLDQIDEQGAKLTKTPTYDELREYRSLIKNFVSSVVSQMYDVSSQTGWDRMGRQKVYTTVRKIDTELENMAEKIRLGQAEQLDVVASHDAIRGMLVDLYM
ncbi:YaaR family protein [uncultured Anaerovibrio sp.]|uniref:YaaR family protein n=1 Tax=uncultured Anaerovibrio sp. TaxID=361586 RepID=UPI0025E6AA8B|nr:YaaR family protein [uncultured Anaerovibrio sp.]